MKVIDLLERRRKNWQELEQLCDQAQGTAGAKMPPANVSRYGALYRAACADLALAFAYQLPQNTVHYLHRLVGRAHNQLYRSRRFEWAKWGEMLLFEVPKTIFRDRCVQIMFCVFWGLFILSAYLAYSKTAWPDFAEQVLTQEVIEKMESDFSRPIDGSLRGGEENMMMAGFYTQHNTSIGLQCFTWGLLVVPGMFVTMYNSISLGSAFGYMARPDVGEAGDHFFHFVTAHGPFELTAIVLSAGAGLRIGLSWMMTGGLSRKAALAKTGRAVMPVMGAAMVMFFMAALIEGFLSPSAAPYWLKVMVAILSSSLLAFYFVVLGFPRRLTVPQQQPHAGLDRTRIAIRERGLLETFDLALHVTREFAGPLVICALLGVVPLALVNYALVGWMVPREIESDFFPGRYLWNMMALIYLEAPLASAFVVAYLGPAVFLEQKTIRQVAGDVLRYGPQLLLCQGLFRGVLLAWLLYLFLDRLEANGFVEGFLMIVLLLVSTGLRAFRPYINEIILLEKNPVWTRQTNAITIGKRSSHLHGPYSGDLLVRWFGTAAIALLLVSLALTTAIMLQGFLISDWPIAWTLEPPEMIWNLDWFKLEIAYPACLWLVVIFLAVVRFLSYLDLRIKHEGWEVELLMRAEALRLAARME